uniref:Uncharacterized protein n=1 Tax=Oryza rufipogon TaxID=4529 RepID=A0A0E0PTN7_ORYRU
MEMEREGPEEARASSSSSLSWKEGGAAPPLTATVARGGADLSHAPTPASHSGSHGGGGGGGWVGEGGIGGVDKGGIGEVAVVSVGVGEGHGRGDRVVADEEHWIEVNGRGTGSPVFRGLGVSKARKIYVTKVLDRRPRREARRLSGIIVLSDGKDIRLLKESLQLVRRDKFGQVKGTKSFEESDTAVAVRRRFRTYTFGFGSYHDPRTLYYLASQGFGTYSFVNESVQNIRDAMALCIGGLTSIVAQDLEVTIRAAHPGVEISSVDSGCHDVLLSSNKHKSIVHIKDLLGDEEKNLIVYRRPKKKLLDGHDLSPEVACEMYRLDVVSRVWGIWTAIPVTTNPAYTTIKGAVKLWEIEGLDQDDVVNQLESLLAAIDPSVQPSADPDMAALRRRLYNDLDKMRTKFSKNVMAGLPYMLSWLSSHRCQRAATRVSASDSCFLTVRMKNMIASVETALAYIIQ